MAKSRWKMNKVGLVDFWYYDEQEFTFADGRMLFRGSNGSGKSVTMQSFIPLLLDGNMRPERLDPFGSRARKMDNYLLEEDDGREERTGYLYMEFKRMESETYATVGIGVRARKNKPLQSWYFGITDGRRIGVDFSLYKDVQNKIAYTKTELRNRIADGGSVMETQSEYIQYVNNLIFGFESLEEYKELINLLIQLRTPKLSKDFKPSIINDILSQSLQPMSEDDLRPVSEAIENMDQLKDHLDELTDSLKAAKQIEKVYRRYNQQMLYDRAAKYRDSEKAYGMKEKEIRKLEEWIVSEKQEQESRRREYTALEDEQELVQKEYDSLRDSDAAKLKNRSVALEQEIRENEQGLSEIAARLERKKEDYSDKNEKLRAAGADRETYFASMEEDMEAMQECVEELSFDETDFLCRELKEERDGEYDFSYHTRMLKEYTSCVKSGVEILQEEKKISDRYDDMLQELDEKKENREECERQLRLYDRQLREQKGELTESVYKWERQNVQFHVASDRMQEIARFIDQYSHGDDYSQVREILYQEKNSQDKLFQTKADEFERLLLPLRVQREELEDEIRRMEETREPEPERTKEVIRSRERLAEQGIPVMPFYKMVDFDGAVPQEVRDRVEGALHHMGILDALIVGEEYREQVLELDDKCCDRYLFGNVPEMEQNLTNIMHIDPAEDNIVVNLFVSDIISSIGLGEGSVSRTTGVDAKGRYRIGILEGNVESGYRSSFIGAAARERYRQDRLAELRAESEKIEEEMRRQNERIEEIRVCRKRLEEELETFPGEEDMKVAAKDYFDQDTLFRQAREEVARYQSKVAAVLEELREVQARVQKVCAPAHLEIRLDVFQEAADSLHEYERQYQKLQRDHGIYMAKVQMEQTMKLDLEALDADLDDLRYRDTLLNRQKIQNETELESVKRQMALTDYETIKERLDFCVGRLREIPLRREELSEEMGSLRTAMEKHTEQRLEETEQLLNLRERREFRRKIFEGEFQLGYVAGIYPKTEEQAELADRICSVLSDEVKNKSVTALTGNLQEVFHQYKGELNEYQPILCPLFEDMQKEGREIGEEGVPRLDIKVKYKGSQISFAVFVDKLESDREDLSHVLSERDRELFEDILSNTVSKRIRARIYESRQWVAGINELMESMDTSSGLKLSLRWASRKSEKEGQLDTNELVELLLSDAEVLRKEDIDKIAVHFRSKITEARDVMQEDNQLRSFYVIMKDILDYRKWFEFQLFCQKTGERKRELTDRIFFTFSGGEKAMSMYVPLFSAVVAKYKGADADAPRIISLDEAFAGVDEMNIRDMFRLMVVLEFDFMMNSQVLWGDYETVPSLAVYQLLRPNNVKYVTVIPYWWNGRERKLGEKPEEESG